MKKKKAITMKKKKKKNQHHQQTLGVRGWGEVCFQSCSIVFFKI